MLTISMLVSCNGWIVDDESCNQILSELQVKIDDWGNLKGVSQSYWHFTDSIRADGVEYLDETIAELSYCALYNPSEAYGTLVIELQGRLAGLQVNIETESQQDDFGHYDRSYSEKTRGIYLTLRKLDEFQYEPAKDD
jgi:hypothetical protein